MSLQYEEEIAKGIATAFLVCHWADRVQAKRQRTDLETTSLFMVGMMNVEQWEAQIPKSNPGPVYYNKAYRLIGRIEERNVKAIDIILRQAMKADGYHFSPPEGYALKFGKFLGYTCLGRVVPWAFDTHSFGLELPTFDLVI